MTCGGHVDVFLEPISPLDKSAKDIFAKVQTAIQNNWRATLLSLVCENNGAGNTTGRWLIVDNGKTVETTGNTVDRIDSNLEELLHVNRPQLKALDKEGFHLFAEPIRPTSTVFIFGAGHISTFLCRLAKMTGFWVVVVDDRKEFANRERFPDADEIIAAPFPSVFEKTTIDDRAYIAIITRGHLHDLEVLRLSLQHPTAYIGMIGSRRKIDMTYQTLMAEGISEQTFKKVHSPIGLEINAETPEEIAISIAAELIKARALHHQQGLLSGS
jgi:xanthine dehydrogenase accessory factor